MKLRIMVLGGTRFIGRRIVEELAGAGHDVVVVHRGQTEPEGMPEVRHVHLDRKQPWSLAEIGDADAVVDCIAFGAADSDATLAVVGDVERLVVLSSMDTYRAYAGLHRGQVLDAVPVDETSPVREGDQRYPYRGQIEGMDDYEKLDVEERWLARGATVLRLPMTYGEHDGQRREEFVLRRVRAGRDRIPIGAANGLLTHGYVGDVARGTRLVLEAPRSDVAGEVFNLGETRTPTVELRARWILEAAGVADRVELVRVPDEALPPDLGLTGAIGQHLLVDSSKARRVLGWQPDDPAETLRTSVEWHLAHPPEGQDDAVTMFDSDDRALALADTASTASASA